MATVSFSLPSCVCASEGRTPWRARGTAGALQPVDWIAPVTECVLGIDAAWTNRQPSGVALLRGGDGNWEAVAVAPSYESFIALADGESTDWWARPRGSPPNPRAVVEAARALSGCEVRLVAIDMPIAKTPFSARRAADTAVSQRFGGRGCAAHSPTAARPEPLGARLTAEFEAIGLPLASSPLEVASGPCSIEVYPHPALLSLVGDSYRVRYKVSRSTRYWPGSSVSDRIGLLLAEFGRIHAALSQRLGPLPIASPVASQFSTLAGLKRHEDALDALVCAWVGSLVLASEAEPLGDESAAVWVPTERPE